MWLSTRRSMMADMTSWIDLAISSGGGDEAFVNRSIAVTVVSSCSLAAHFSMESCVADRALGGSVAVRARRTSTAASRTSETAGRIGGWAAINRSRAGIASWFSNDRSEDSWLLFIMGAEGHCSVPGSPDRMAAAGSVMAKRCRGEGVG